jgi:D-glycero-alpha-D-manno-heptose-7-phosphate kinase
MLAAAKAAGAWSGKVCGAGGGGCLFCIGPPENAAAIASALSASGARVLDFHVETQGLKIETRVAVS